MNIRSIKTDHMDGRPEHIFIVKGKEYKVTSKSKRSFTFIDEMKIQHSWSFDYSKEYLKPKNYFNNEDLTFLILMANFGNDNDEN